MSWLSVNRILVTGGAGFIGSHLSKKLLENGFDVVVLDNLNDYYPPEIKKKNLELCSEIGRDFNSSFEFIEADIRDNRFIKKIFRDFNFDAVFHEAAQAGVRYSVEDPVEPNEVNVDGTLNLLEASVDSDVDLFVNASSSSVYGETKYLPFDEEHPKKPKSPYGVSKLAGEQYCRVYHELYDINTVSLRYFTVYGPRMRPGMAISNSVERCLGDKPPVIFGDGEKTRDFTYIKDIIDANMLLMENENAYGDVLNVGSGHNITIQELAEHIIQETGFNGMPEYVESKKGDVQNTYADITKASELIDYKPEIDIQEGIKRYVEWFKRNKDWYKPIN